VIEDGYETHWATFDGFVHPGFTVYDPNSTQHQVETFRELAEDADDFLRDIAAEL